MLALALFLLGIGLLLTGINILSDTLKRMGSRAFRRLALRYMAPRWKALLLGLVSGAALQSTSAAMVILASLNTVGSITAAQAISILTGFSVGNCVMPFLISFKIRTVVFFLVGLSSILLYFIKEDRLRNLSGIIFGLGLIFFGIEMMLDGVRPLRDEPWFGQAMTFAGNWPGLSLLVGAVLGFLVQSSTAVVVVAIGLAKGGILSGDEIFLIMYGAAVGSTLFKSFLGSTLSGSGRQLVRFVNLFNFTGAGFFILLYYIESYLDVPLIMALVTGISADPAVQAAWAFLLLNLTAGLIYTAFHHPLVARLARQFPTTEEEALSKPRYLFDVSPDDPHVALDLIGMEQFRAFKQVAEFPSALTGGPGGELQQRRLAAEMLAREIDSALAEVNALRLDADTARRLAVLQTRQTLLKQLADSTAELTTAIREARQHPRISRLAAACFETVDFLFQNAIELIQSGDDKDADQHLLYSDRGQQMQQLRDSYLNTYSDLTQEARASLMNITLGVDKCIWLLDRVLILESGLRIRNANSPAP